MAEYLLYYWPGIPGRGEYVRLVLAAGEADWIDVEREGAPDGEPSLSDILDDETCHPAPFAPPFIKHGDVLLAQTALILDYVGARLSLAPEGKKERRFALQLALTNADLVAEAHDVHHPVAAGLYYEDQKEAAARAAEPFREKRIPKFLDYFSHVLKANRDSDDWLVGEKPSYADIAVAHTIEGLKYAFPNTMERALEDRSSLARLSEQVHRIKGIAAYLKSDRRQDFNEHGIFRHYPELDTRR